MSKSKTQKWTKMLILDLLWAKFGPFYKSAAKDSEESDFTALGPRDHAVQGFWAILSLRILLRVTFHSHDNHAKGSKPALTVEFPAARRKFDGCLKLG